MLTEFRIRTTTKREMIDLTARVAEIVARADVAEGLCSVYTPHATAAIVINENDDPNVCVDVLDALDRLVPAGVWRHDKVDGNAASHIQATILGPGETIPVRAGKLLLGRWQAVMRALRSNVRAAPAARPRPTPARLPPRAARALSRSASLAIGADVFARAWPATTRSPCAGRWARLRPRRPPAAGAPAGSSRATP